MINISNITNNVDNKQAFKLIGFIFGGIFGAFFSIICIFSTIDHIVYSTAYTQHDGLIIETDEVESYTSTTTRYKKVGGRRRKVTKTTTRHRQDVVVEYDNEIVEIEDVSVDANGYSVNDEVSIYVNKKNPEKVKIHADVSDHTFLVKLFAFLVVYWLIYFLLYKKRKKNKKQ